MFGTTTRARAGVTTRALIGVGAGALTGALVLALLAGPAPPGRPLPARRRGRRRHPPDHGCVRPGAIALRLSSLGSDQLVIDVGDDGSAEQSFDLATFRAIAVDAGSGDDVVRIDQVNGAFDD